VTAAGTRQGQGQGQRESDREREGGGGGGGGERETACTTSRSLSTYSGLQSAWTCWRTDSSAGGKCEVLEEEVTRILVSVTHASPAAVSTATCVRSVSTCMSSATSSSSTSISSPTWPASIRRCWACRTCASNRDAQMAKSPANADSHPSEVPK
jgi:hypothetical protein